MDTVCTAAAAGPADPVHAAEPVDDRAARRAAGERVAELLGERGSAAHKIVALSDLLGLAFLADALALTSDALERDDPLLTRRPNGKAKTWGGVFFKVARLLGQGAWGDTLSPEDKRRLFSGGEKKKLRRAAKRAFTLQQAAALTGAVSKARASRFFSSKLRRQALRQAAALGTPDFGPAGRAVPTAPTDPGAAEREAREGAAGQPHPVKHARKEGPGGGAWSPGLRLRGEEP